jgi:hypothetical protein
MRKIVLTENQIKFVIDKYINEQMFRNEKFDNLNLIISTRNPKDLANIKRFSLESHMRNAGLMTDKKTGKLIPVSDPKEFENNLNFIQSKMDETSKNVFESAKTINPSFYYYVINQYFIIGRDPTVKNMKIVVDSATTVKDVPKPGAQTPAPNQVIEPGYELVTPAETNTSGFFVDNEATLTTAFTSFVANNIVAAINQAKENLSKSGGTQAIYLESLNIDSSCSKLANGPSRTVQTANANRVPSFMELSTARANAARDYIVNTLTKMKAQINPAKITINPNGENGDGTSGPEFKGTDKASYNQYKYVRINLVFAIRTSVEAKTAPTQPQGIPPEMIPQSTTDFTIHFTAKGRNDFKIYLPTFSLKIPGINLGGNGMRASTKQVRCPKTP